MIGLLKLVSPTTWGIVALVGAAAWAAHLFDVGRHERIAEARGRAAVQGLWDAEKTLQQAAAIAAHEEARREEARRVREQQEISNEAQRLAARHLAALAALDRAGQRLRPAVASALAADDRGAGGHSTPAGAGTPAEDAPGVCAQLLGAADTRLRVLASAADAAHGAGRACERAYDSLMP